MSAPTVLYSVLDWGLGHATRSIPVIRLLLSQGYRVIIAGEGRSLELLTKEFPAIETELLEGFRVYYPEKNMTGWILANFPRMLSALKREKKQTRELVLKYGPDLIISDHRYGFYDDGIRSVLIAHQLRIRAGIFSSLLHQFHKRLLKSFNEIWVPDYESWPGLSGELSHHASLAGMPLRFIGPLSRVQDITATDSRKYDVLIISSGPEPQRSIFEQECTKQLTDSEYKVMVLQGIPGAANAETDTITYCADPSSEMLRSLIVQTPVIICRSGYSTLMDLAACGRNAILVPTPGQTEQLYLAELNRKNGFSVVKQAEADFITAIRNFTPSFSTPPKLNQTQDYTLAVLQDNLKVE